MAVHTTDTRKLSLFPLWQTRIVHAQAHRFCSSLDGDLSTLLAPSPSCPAGVPGLYACASCQVCFPVLIGAETAGQFSFPVSPFLLSQ